MQSKNHEILNNNNNNRVSRIFTMGSFGVTMEQEQEEEEGTRR